MIGFGVNSMAAATETSCFDPRRISKESDVSSFLAHLFIGPADHEIPGYGLEIQVQEVNKTKVSEKGILLTSHIKITNVSDQNRPVENLATLLRSEDNDLLGFQIRIPAKSVISPSEEITTEFKMLNPPRGVHNMEVTFTQCEPEKSTLPFFDIR